MISVGKSLCAHHELVGKSDLHHRSIWVQDVERGIVLDHFRGPSLEDLVELGGVDPRRTFHVESVCGGTRGELL